MAKSDSKGKAVSGVVRAGIGGWTYEPWRGVFFPEGLAHTKELAYASRQLSAIEVNGTYYRTQSAAVFEKWHNETPDDFVFAVKALRYCTNRKVLAEAEESVGKFLGSGLFELGDKLGPILWQFAPTKRFEEDDFGAFLEFLPPTLNGSPLRHALEVRHDSFCDPAFVALAKKHKVAIVFADSETYPAIGDVTTDFVYARLESAKEQIFTGYSEEELDRWADIARAWASGAPTDLPQFGDKMVKPAAHDVFVFMISGAKVRAPAAAMALISRLKSASAS